MAFENFCFCCIVARRCWPCGFHSGARVGESDDDGEGCQTPLPWVLDAKSWW